MKRNRYHPLIVLKLTCPVCQITIWELASVSKAFTALGILLLEEQGFLSMDDSVVEYLPWFSLRYQGQPVDMQSVTLNHFLHHTTGLINRYHTQHIPEGNTPDMLQKTVEMLIDAEVVFPPGERYEFISFARWKYHFGIY